MRQLESALRLLAVGVLLSGLSTAVFAQEKNQDRMKETAITGCLTKDASGGYQLADEKTGVKTTVTGSADLEKHSANHKVTLTGITKDDPAGKAVLQVSKVTMVDASCKAPE